MSFTKVTLAALMVTSGIFISHGAVATDGAYKEARSCGEKPEIITDGGIMDWFVNAFFWLENPDKNDSILPIDGGTEADLHTQQAKSGSVKPPRGLTRHFERNIHVEFADSGYLHFFRDQSNPAARALLYLHGGAYVQPLGYWHWKFLEELAGAASNHDMDMFVLDYPLAPAFTLDAIEQQTLQAYRILLEQYPAETIAIAGDSAGGHLALNLMLQLKAEDTNILPGKAVLIAPWVDLYIDNRDKYPNIDRLLKRDKMLNMSDLRFAADSVKGDRHEDSPLASPINADLNGLPSILMTASTSDALFDQNCVLQKKLEASTTSSTLLVGIDQQHVFPLFPNRAGAEARKAISAFIDAP